MTEKQKPAEAPKAWRGKPANFGYDNHAGEKAPIRYSDSAGKKLGNWLLGLLTPWK